MTLITAILLAILCWPRGAAAQGPPPCADDVKRFCAGMQPGGGRIIRCLQEHAAELSPGCKAAASGTGRGAGKGGKKGNPWIRDCEADVAKLCPGVERGGGRIHTCLLAHTGELSPACKTALDNRPRRAAAASPAPTTAPTPATP